MLELRYYFLVISRHIYAHILLFVVSFQGYPVVERSCFVYLDTVPGLFDRAGEMVKMLLTYVLDAKIIHDQRTLYRSCDTAPQSRRERHFIISCRQWLLMELFVS